MRVLVFEGDAKQTAKAKKLVESAIATTATDLLANRKRKLSDVPIDLPAPSKDPTPTKWVQLGGIVLTGTDNELILAGEKLNDLHINMVQRLLKRQFSEITGLKPILLQTKKQLKVLQHIQIIRSRGDHWIVASTVFAASDEVKVYDSVYHTLDQTTKSIISNLFQTSTELVRIPRQTGGCDCGVYAIAISDCGSCFSLRSCCDQV